MEFLLTKIKENLNEQMLLLTISNPRKAEEVKKYNIRPILVKDKLVFQSAAYTKTQVFHKNLSKRELLEEVEKNIKDKTINEEVIVQAGYTKYQSDKMKIIDLMSKEQLSKFQDEASLIITHGGVGSIVSSIEKGKKVIAVPRKHEYGEHVNNHQEEIVKDFNSKGYIIGIENVEDLKQAIIKVKDFKPKKYKPNNQKMLEILENFIENI